MKLFKLAAVFIGAAVMAQSAYGLATLKVLDKAPPIKVAKWVKGAEVSTLEPSKTYVVEFWATWCGPCKVSIPHLTELAQKFRDKVTFIGVDCYEHPASETDTSYYEKVGKFVTDMGDKMNYNVAIDGPDGAMAKSWMEAAGQNGIPTAFVVKDNTIQWIGHPMEMEPVLAPVLAGTFDAKKAAVEREKREALAAKQAKVMAPINQAAMKSDWQGALTATDKAMAANPDMALMLSQIRLSILMRTDEKAMYAYARKLADTTAKNDPMFLNQVAWMMVDDKAPLKTRDYPTAVYLAEKAVKASNGQDPNILDTLGLAYYKAGNVDKAIQVQTKAVTLADNPDSKVTDENKKDLKDRLEMFKSNKK